MSKKLSNIGRGILVLAFVAFVVLKLIGIITWSWSFFWAGIALVLFVLLVVIIIKLLP